MNGITPGTASSYVRTRNIRRLGCALAVALALLTVAAPAAAQEGGEIDIDVVAQGGKKLADVQVTVVSASGETLATGVTNKKGKFKTTIKESGNHILKLSKEGYGPVEREMNITGGVVMSGSLTMLDEESYRKSQAIESFNAGVAAIQRGDEDGALEGFSRAAEFDPSIADAHRMVAAIQLTKGNWEAAGTSVLKYLETKELDSTIAPIAFEYFRHVGDPRKDEAKALVLGTPAAEDAAIAVFNDGVQRNKDGDTKGAIAAWEEAVELDPSLAAGHQSLAALEFNDQDYEKALDHVNHLLEIRPSSKPGLRMAFYSNVFLKRTDGAVAAGKAWFAAEDGATAEVAKEAERLFEEDQLSNALVLGEALVAAAPDFPRGRYALGKMYASAGKVDKAKTELQKFIQLAPSDPDAEAAKQMLASL